MESSLAWGLRSLEGEWGLAVLAAHALLPDELPWELAGRWEPQADMPFSKRYRVRSHGPPSSPFLHNIRFPLSQAFAPDAVGLILVWLRARRGGSGVHVVEEVAEPYFTCAREPFRLGPGWTQFWIPFRCPQAYSAGQLRYQVWLPTGPQELEIGGVALYELAEWPVALAPGSTAPRVPVWKRLDLNACLEEIPETERRAWQRQPQASVLLVQPSPEAPLASGCWPLEAAIVEGDWLLLRAQLKGQGLVEHMLQGNRWDDCPWLWHFHRLQPEGEVVCLCFLAGSSATEGEVCLELQLWQGDGWLEVQHLQVLNFGQGERPLPAPTVVVSGRPSAPRAESLRPDFRLGCSVRLRQLDQPGYLEGLCGWAGSGRGFNDLTPDWELTWKGWSLANPLQRSASLQWLRRLRQAGMTLKGHFLVSNNPDRLPPELGFDLDDPARMLSHVESRIDSILGCELLVHSLDRWDVWNEAFTYSGLLQRCPGPDLLAWFRRARQLAPGVKLCLNEGSLLTAGSLERRIRAEMERLSDQVEGPFVLGLQGHFRGSFPTRQELQDTLGGLCVPGWELEISELDWSGISDEGAAAFLDELLDVALACPQLAGLSFWGFSEQVEGPGQGMLVDLEGRLKPAGQVLKQRFFEGPAPLPGRETRMIEEDSQRVWNQPELSLALTVGAPCHDRILQNAEELEAWRQWMQAKGVASYLEIGIWTGALLRYWRAHLPELRLAACDLGWAEQAGLPLKLPEGVDFLKASSQSPEFSQWRAGLGHVDVVMINGDHEYAAVLADYERNRTFPHRFLVFHDVDNPNPELAGVRRFWEELDGYKLTLRGSDLVLRCGIGIWSQSEDPA